MSMSAVDLLNVILMFSLAIALFGIRNKFGPAIRDLLHGGPRPRSHPIPADDSRILNRPRSACVRSTDQQNLEPLPNGGV
jgi:hypothetical protein